MKTIKENVTNEIIINKSRFITLIYKINNEDDVSNILNNLKKEYKDATHYCYGYIINNVKKCSDDNEPSGTAGIPILSVLEANNLNMALCVVVRYFGGVKLGAGGLIRAYRKSVNECIKLSSLINLIDGYLIEISFNYDESKKYDNLIKEYNVVSKSFDDLVTYQLLIPKTDLNKFHTYKIIKDNYIEL